MSLKSVAAVLFAAGLAVLPLPARAGTPTLAEVWNAPAIAWHDLRSGIPEATKTGKTVMMVFHASWCTACKSYRSVFKDPGVVEASRNLVMILVDADADKVANGAFAPDGTYVPRTVFLTPDGDVRSDLVSKTDPEHPHSFAVDKPEDVRAQMVKAGGAPAATPPADAPDQRASKEGAGGAQ